MCVSFPTTMSWLTVPAFPHNPFSDQGSNGRCVSYDQVRKLTFSLLDTARLAFDTEPPFERYAEQQEPFAVAIPNIVKRFSRVAEDDAVEVDDRPSDGLAGL